MTHVLGWITVGWTAITAVGVTYWLGSVHDIRTWRRKVVAPKLVEGPVTIARDNPVGYL